MEQLPEDIIRTLGVYLLPNERFIFARVCHGINVLYNPNKKCKDDTNYSYSFKMYYKHDGKYWNDNFSSRYDNCALNLTNFLNLTIEQQVNLKYFLIYYCQIASISSSIQRYLNTMSDNDNSNGGTDENGLIVMEREIEFESESDYASSDDQFEIYRKQGQKKFIESNINVTKAAAPLTYQDIINMLPSHKNNNNNKNDDGDNIDKNTNSEKDKNTKGENESVVNKDCVSNRDESKVEIEKGDLVLTDLPLFPNDIYEIYLHENDQVNKLIVKWFVEIVQTMIFCEKNSKYVKNNKKKQKNKKKYLNYIEGIYFDSSNLKDQSIRAIATGLSKVSKKMTQITSKSNVNSNCILLHNLKYLSLCDNIEITDKTMELLFFFIIGKYCPNLEHLVLNDTGIGNDTCLVIYGFYKMYYCNCVEKSSTNQNKDKDKDNKCHKNPTSESDENKKSDIKGCDTADQSSLHLSLNQIELKFNKKINESGIDRLNCVFDLPCFTQNKQSCCRCSLLLPNFYVFGCNFDVPNDCWQEEIICYEEDDNFQD